MKKLLGLLLLTGASAFAAHFSFGVAVGAPVYGPPPPPVYSYYRPVAPGPNYTWVGGYWYPAGPRYAWRAGYWAPRPYAGAYWVAPRYYRGSYYRGSWRR